MYMVVTSLIHKNDHLHFLNIGCSCVLVSSLIAEKANSSSKLSVASRGN